MAALAIVVCVSSFAVKFDLSSSTGAKQIYIEALALDCVCVLRALLFSVCVLSNLYTTYTLNKRLCLFFSFLQYEMLDTLQTFTQSSDINLFGTDLCGENGHFLAYSIILRIDFTTYLWSSPLSTDSLSRD